MKLHVIKIMLLALATAFSVGQTAYAQKEQARDLFTSHAANPGKGQPGAKISLELLRNGQRSFVPLNTSFYAGDKVKLHFEVNFAAYVTIYNAGTSGQIKKLYPAQSNYASPPLQTSTPCPPPRINGSSSTTRRARKNWSSLFSSTAPVKRPAKPQPKATPKTANKKIETDVVIVEPGGRSLDEEESDQALANGRDLNPVQLKDGYYVVGSAQQLKQRIGVLIVLDHR